MNELEKLEAYEMKALWHTQALGLCEVCKEWIPLDESQLAHRIPKHVKYVKKYGKSVIHHRFNMALTCAGCNSRVLIDPATHPVEVAELVEKINKDLGRIK